MEQLETNGRIEVEIFPEEILGKLSRDCEKVVFKGRFNRGVYVALKRFKKPNNSADQKNFETSTLEIIRDLEVLQEPNNQHENFILFYGSFDIDGYTYIATELCKCSVADLYDERASDELSSIRNNFPVRDILFQSAQGVAFLHDLNRVHRNLSPNNFLITLTRRSDVSMKYVIKLSDFRCSKKLEPGEKDQESGFITTPSIWKAPESLPGSVITQQVDVFILGCFFHYVLSKGRHPFGQGYQVQANLVQSDHEIYKKETWIEKAGEIGKMEAHLIYNMIQFEASNRLPLRHLLKVEEYFKKEEPYILYSHLDQTKPGLCVIISQENFDKVFCQTCLKSGIGLKDLRGHNSDAIQLSRTFQTLGYDVRMYRNLESGEMVQLMDDLSKTDKYIKKTAFCPESRRENFRNYSSLVVCILSHGYKGAVYGVDSDEVGCPRSVFINRLKYTFNSQNCPELNGKPKIFIVQACRGSNAQKTDYGLLAMNNNEMSYSKSRENLKEEDSVVIQSRRSDDTLNSAPLMDFIDLMDTMEEFLSWVWDEEDNFVSSLCRALLQSAEIGSIKSLEEAYQAGVINKMTGATLMYQMKQTPEIGHSCLSRKIYFQVKKTRGEEMEVKFDGREKYPVPRKVQCCWRCRS